MYTLLVVDDKEIFHRMIARTSYFKSNQDKFCIKYSARNGLEALELLQKADIDIVLTDIRMPFMNGIELLREINKKKLCKCTILLSAYSDFAYAKEGIINGAFDYIVKPVDDDKLKGTFDRAYGYMQSFADSASPFLDSIANLANSIAAVDERQVFTNLNIVADYIQRNNSSFSAMMLAFHEALEWVKHQLTTRYPYIGKYLPIGKICALEPISQSKKDLMKDFRERILLLHRLCFKFEPRTSSKLIQDIWTHVISNIEAVCTLQSVAEKFYVNKKYLSSLFKKEAGMCYVSFVTYFKIERAKMLLSYSDLKIYNVAEALGFTNTEYFSKIFKNQTGVAPNVFHWNDLI